MKITKNNLKQMISEVLEEGWMGGDVSTSAGYGAKNEGKNNMKLTRNKLKQLIREEFSGIGDPAQKGVDPTEVQMLVKDIQTALKELTSGDYESAHETLKDVVDDLADLADIKPLDTENPYYKQSTEGYL